MLGSIFGPRYSVGQCYLWDYHSRTSESWENRRDYAYKVLEVGKNAYKTRTVAVTNGVYGSLTYEDTLIFGIEDSESHPIECPEILNKETVK